jgi:hypothetical protein
MGFSGSPPASSIRLDGGSSDQARVLGCGVTQHLVSGAQAYSHNSRLVKKFLGQNWAYKFFQNQMLM